MVPRRMMLRIDLERLRDAPSWPDASQGRGGGIDLPGFVRRRSDQLRRSLRKEGGRPAPVPLG